MRPVCRVLTIILIGALAACESGLDRRYLGASLGENLEIPPDLVETETDSKFELPAAFSGDDANARDRVPVLARVDSVKLEHSGNMYWLSVEEPVGNLYQQVKNFWAAEGYRLALDEPVIGVMETEWVLTQQGDSEQSGGWFARFFGNRDLTAAQDQFRTRLERGADGESRVYIAHRGTEYRYNLEVGEGQIAASLEATGKEDNQWRFRQPEPELEIEMLSRLAVYLGLQQSKVDAQTAEVKLYSPRAYYHVDADENSPYLILKDPYQIGWNRVYHQLERMNFDIESAEYKSGLSNEGVITLKVGVIDKDEGGGLFSFFSSSKEAKVRPVILVLSEETHELTRVEIENADGDLDTSAEGRKFMNLMYQQLK